MSHSQILITSPQPLSRLCNLLNGADRKVHLDNYKIDELLSLNMDHPILTMHYTNHGPCWLFSDWAIEQGLGLNVMVKGSLTAYFTPKLFFLADEMVNPGDID